MDENQKLTATPGDAGLQQRATIFVTGLATRFNELDPSQRKLLVALAAVLVACAAGLIWYGTRTDWRTLYAGLDPADAREMAAELTAANLSYDVSADGTSLRVPVDQLDKARLVTTAKGGPRSGRMGFELFDKPNWIGSEFDEKVNYQRALEGELEHTINTLSDVESSRVHLVMPHDSLFNEQQRDAKASVVLKLRRRTLSEEESDSIRNLVASAVDDLHPENVVLVDAAGRQLGRKGGSAEAAAHEQELAEKLVETLEPVAGVGNVRASVNVEYDTSTTDETDESYDPNNVVALSMQRSEETTGGQTTPSGIPGTASNAPNAQPPLYPKIGSQTQSLKQESGTYGASKKVRHTIQGLGRIRRITAAVLINHRMVVAGKQISWQPRSAVEMKHLNDLAEAAVGYDPSRGDLVSLEDLQFEDQSLPEPPLSERLLRTASQSETLIRFALIALLALVALLFVVRPMVRKVQFAGGARELPAPGEAALEAGMAQPAATVEQLATEKHKQQAQAVFDQVLDHLRREPAQSTRLLQSWIHTE